MKWDPGLYARFADHRLRPAVDLLGRIPLDTPSRVVDLGCGTGNVTSHLASRWPDAEVLGVDGSAEMLEEAGAVAARFPRVRFVRADLNDWQVADGTDVLYSNAALHWLSGHSTLFPKLIGQVRHGGMFAIQMPRNFGAPSHQIAQDLAGSARWRAKLGHLVQPAPVSEPGFYYDLLKPLVSRLDLWETEYIQPLSGDRPVLQWIKGTWLRQFLAVLDGDEAAIFEEEYAERAAMAYPVRRDGMTILPFRRLFIVAVR